MRDPRPTASSPARQNALLGGFHARPQITGVQWFVSSHGALAPWMLDTGESMLNAVTHEAELDRQALRSVSRLLLTGVASASGDERPLEKRREQVRPLPASASTLCLPLTQVRQ